MHHALLEIAHCRRSYILADVSSLKISCYQLLYGDCGLISNKIIIDVSKLPSVELPSEASLPCTQMERPRQREQQQKAPTELQKSPQPSVCSNKSGVAAGTYTTVELREQ